MLRLSLIRRIVPRPLMMLCGTLGFCSLALIAAVTVGVDANNPADGSQYKATEKPEEAPADFDNQTNEFEVQDAFDDDRKEFEKNETILPDKKMEGGGLGPVYNATSCASCHQNPVSGSSSQIAELRAGHREPDPKDPRKVKFVPARGGSLIAQRAIDPAIQEHVPPEEVVRTLRMSTNVLGNGFAEVIPDEEILRIKKEQPHGMQ